jgi:hypothetical protein
MVMLIIDHSYFVFTQYIILRTKWAKCSENFSRSSPSKCGSNDNVTISKNSYYLRNIFLLLILLTWLYHVSANSDGVSFFLIFWFLEDFPLPQPFRNKLNNCIACSKTCSYDVPLKEQFTFSKVFLIHGIISGLLPLWSLLNDLIINSTNTILNFSCKER